MWALLVAWGDVIIAIAAIAGGIVLEKKFGVYDKAKVPFGWLVSAFAWIKGKF